VECRGSDGRECGRRRTTETHEHLAINGAGASRKYRRLEEMEVSGPPNHPRELGSPVSDAPITGEGPRPFYPPMCIQTHWDPGMILRRTLPTAHVAQTLDPRPWAKVCLQYTTTGEDVPAPIVDPSVVLPPGGQFYPASRYSAAIDNESQLRRLDRPLGTCDEDQYRPPESGDMFNSRLLVPRSAAVSSRVAEVAFPKTLMMAGPYPCRHENDVKNLELSDRLFNNATKQDRYKLLGKSSA